jgi:excisionase family DNA binding protein
MRFVRRLVAERRIPFLKVGRSVRFDPADVDAWLERAKVPVTSWRHAGAP